MAKYWATPPQTPQSTRMLAHTGIRSFSDSPLYAGLSTLRRCPFPQQRDAVLAKCRNMICAVASKAVLLDALYLRMGCGR